MRRLLSGDRRVWLVAAAVLAASAVGVLAYLLKSAERYTGTNSVGVRSIVADVQSGQQFCVRDFDLPDGTARVQVAIGWPGDRRPALDAVLHAGQAVRRATLPAAAISAPAPRPRSTSPCGRWTPPENPRPGDSA